MSPETNETYVGVHLKFWIYLPDFNQIWVFLIDIHECSQYQISSGKRADTCGQTGRHTGGYYKVNRHFSEPCERLQKLAAFRSLDLRPSSSGMRKGDNSCGGPLERASAN